MGVAADRGVVADEFINALMNSLFIIQLVTSFVAGGMGIALLTLLAERAPRKISGIILMFPSTVVLGYFFLGWTLSPEAVALAVPASIITTGVNIFYIICYLLIANQALRLFQRRIPQIILGLGVSFPLWLAVATLIIHHKPAHLTIALPVYLLLVVLGLLALKKFPDASLRSFHYTRAQKIGRAIFSGLVISTIVFLGKTLGPFWGGVFAAFPSAITSSLTIFHWYYEPWELASLVRAIPLGSLSTVSFMLVAKFTFPMMGIMGGTIIGLAGSLLVALALSKIPSTPGRG